MGAGLSLAHHASAEPSLTTLRSAPWRVDAADGADVTGLKLERAWSQEFCQPKLVNSGKRPVRVKQIVLFALTHGLPPGAADARRLADIRVHLLPPVHGQILPDGADAGSGGGY